MNRLRPPVEMLKRITRSKPVRYIFSGCLLLAVILLIIKSCSSNMGFNTTYRIGQDNRWSNIDFLGKERHVTAFNNELLTDIAKKEHFHIRMKTIPTQNLLKDLENGKLQGIIAPMQPSVIYEKRLIFSEPLLLLGPVLIIRSSAPIAGWNEMGKKIIGVQPHVATLLNLEKDPSVQIRLYSDILKALADLSDREIDGVIYPAFPAHVYTKTFYSHELKIASFPLTDEGVRLVALKNEQGKELIEQFNAGLEALKQNGTYNRLIDRWGLVNVEDISP